MTDNPPNIIFIMTDQQRWDSIAQLGNRVLETPVLDSLCREGVCFTNCFAEAPVCVASRVVWLTGQHPWTTGSRTNKHVPLDPTRTLPGLLTAAGYRAHAAGKMHFSPQRALHGFETSVICESGRGDPDDFHAFLATTPWAGLERGHGVGNNDIFAAASPLPEPYYISSWTAAISIDFIEQHLASGDERPFFLNTSFSKPHSPYDPPHPYDRLYRPWDMPRPYRRSGEYGTPAQELQARYYTWDTLGEEQILQTRAHYFGNCTHIDHCIGRLLAALERLGIRDNTVILLNSDHGDLMGDHNLYFKANFYEGSTHVPLIVWIPPALRKRLGLRAPGDCHQLVSLQDVMPTLLDIAGVDAPEGVDGKSLLTLLRDGAPENRENIIHGAYGYAPNLQLMAREAQYKYIFHQNGRFEQLFDLAEDPGELDNLAHEKAHSTVRDRLRGWLVEHLKERGVGEDVVAGDDLVGCDFDPSLTVFQPIKGPWGRRPY